MRRKSRAKKSPFRKPYGIGISYANTLNIKEEDGTHRFTVLSAAVEVWGVDLTVRELLHLGRNSWIPNFREQGYGVVLLNPGVPICDEKYEILPRPGHDSLVEN